MPPKKKKSARAKAVPTAPVSPPPLRDAYHHVVPRFILSRYQSTPPMSRGEREKLWKVLKQDPRKLWYYDFASGALEQRSFSVVYGVKNLYRDVTNINDADELENKLAVLERETSFVVDKIHTSVDSGTVALLRSEVETLRKFNFIMHYRSDLLSQNYFNADHPDHVSVREHMEEIKLATTQGRDATPADIWMFYLRYYLDTPHHVLIDRGERFQNLIKDRIRSGKPGEQRFRSGDDVLDSVAGAYAGQGLDYYMGIWRAAEGYEFLLSNNSFGLWEGLAPGCAMIHRLFVLSPKVAVILRTNLARPESPVLDSDHVNSDLFKIPVQSPHRTSFVRPSEDPFSNAPGPYASASSRKRFDETVSVYRAGPGQKDTFKFPVTTLSAAQMDDMNFTLLRNARTETGGMSFCDAMAASDTISRFRASTLKSMREFKGAILQWRADMTKLPFFEPFQEKLEELCAPHRKMYSLSHALHFHHRRPFDLGVKDDRRPTKVFLDLLSPTSMGTTYARAYRLHIALRDSVAQHRTKEKSTTGSGANGFALAYEAVSRRLVDEWRSSLALPALELGGRADQRLGNLGLCEDMAEKDSADFFSAVESIVGNTARGQTLSGYRQCGSADLRFIKLFAEAVYVGCAEKMLKESPVHLFACMEKCGVQVTDDEILEKIVVERVRRERMAWEKEHMEMVELEVD